MNTRVQEYKDKREQLMTKWDKECRNWLEQENGAPIIAAFFKDGIIDPDTWFQNDFRPLFILKEVQSIWF